MFIIKLIKKYPIFFVLLLIGIIISIISGLVIVAAGLIIFGLIIIIIVKMSMKKKIKESGEILKYLQKPSEEEGPEERKKLKSNIFQLKKITSDYIMFLDNFSSEKPSKIQDELILLYDDHDRIIEQLTLEDIEDLLGKLHSIKTDISNIIMTKNDKKDLKKINKEFDDISNNINKIITVDL